MIRKYTVLITTIKLWPASSSGAAVRDGKTFQDASKHAFPRPRRAHSDETHREHLYRVHITPIECSRCWLNLKTEKDLADHVRKQTPCEVRPQLVEWIPREKIKVLKDRKNALLGR